MSGKRHVDSGVILKHLAVAVASVLPVIFRVLPKGKVGATHKIHGDPQPCWLNHSQLRWRGLTIPNFRPGTFFAFAVVPNLPKGPNLWR